MILNEVLSIKEKENYKNEFIIIINNENKLRIFRNNKIEVVPINYFDEEIIKIRKNLKTNKNIDVAVDLKVKYNLSIYTALYLIERLDDDIKH